MESTTPGKNGSGLSDSPIIVRPHNIDFDDYTAWQYLQAARDAKVRGQHLVQPQNKWLTVCPTARPRKLRIEKVEPEISSTQSSSKWHGQESFDTYQEKIKDLAHDLYTLEDVETEHMKGGSYNRVVAVKMRHAGIDRVTSGVFRIARNQENEDDNYVDENVIDNIAILNFLHYQDILCPSVIAFDAMRHNALGSSFMLFERVPGMSLLHVHDTMTHLEKLSIAKTYAEFLVRFETIRFSKIGYLRCDYDSNGFIATQFAHLGGKIPWNIPAVKVQHFGKTNDPYTFQPASETTYDFLEATFKRRYFDQVMPNNNFWGRALKMLNEFKEAKFFEGDDKPSRDTIILHHWDLEARNIMVEPHTPAIPNVDGSNELDWTISSILDWDEVRALPAIMTRKPPAWLWDESLPDGQAQLYQHSSIPIVYHGDNDYVPLDRYSVDNHQTLTPHHREIKTLFETTLVQGLSNIYPDYSLHLYYDEAYGSGRWIRRLAQFAISGIHSHDAMRRFDFMEFEWKNGPCVALTMESVRKAMRRDLILENVGQKDQR